MSKKAKTLTAANAAFANTIVQQLDVLSSALACQVALVPSTWALSTTVLWQQLELAHHLAQPWVQASVHCGQLTA